MNGEWFFETEADQEVGIETRVYENGNKVKRATLSGGVVVTVRECTGADVKKAMSLIDKKSASGDYLGIMMQTASKFTFPDNTEKQLTIEEIEALKAKDYNTIMALTTALNF